MVVLVPQQVQLLVVTLYMLKVFVETQVHLMDLQHQILEELMEPLLLQQEEVQ